MLRALAALLVLLQLWAWRPHEPGPGPYLTLPTSPRGATVYAPQTDLFLPKQGTAVAGTRWTRLGQTPGPVAITLKDLPMDVRLELPLYEPRRVRLEAKDFVNATYAGGIRLQPAVPVLAPLSRSPWAVAAVLCVAVDLVLRRRRPRVERRVGGYTLIRPLGSGGRGEVWLTQDGKAIKLLHEREAREELRREVQGLRQVRHPNVVMLYDWGEHEGTLYLVMEHVEGEPLAPGAPLERIRETASALQAIHEQGLVHRDVKPANLLVTARGVKLMDFGLTAAQSEGSTAGTPGFMAPEQIRGEPVDARADLYALGAVLGYLLKGSSVFPGETPLKVMQAQLEGRWEAPPGLSPELSRLLSSLLAVNPDERPASAAEVVASLDSLP